jgi:hypothetical protein
VGGCSLDMALVVAESSPLRRLPVEIHSVSASLAHRNGKADQSLDSTNNFFGLWANTEETRPKKLSACS